MNLATSFLRKFYLLPFLCGLLGYFDLSAQVTSDLGEKRISQFVLRSWNTEDGLASESSNELIQTADGYIWIATYNGLHRFDGADFTIFNSQNSSIPSSNVLCLEQDKNGDLWVGTLHGLARFSDNKFIVPDPLQEINDFSLEEMRITDQGHIWFSTKSNQVFSYRGDTLVDYTAKFSVQNSTILSIAEDKNGKMLFGTDDSKLIIYSNDLVSTYQLPIDVNGINDIYEYESKLYLGTGRGLYTWNGESIEKEKILSNTAITKLIARKDNLWLGTMTGLFRYDNTANELDSLNEQSGMPNNLVRDLVFDLEGNLWVGTYRSGIFFLSEGSFTSYSQNDGLATDIITSVTEISKGVYLLGNENGMLDILREGKISRYNSPIRLPEERLKNLFTDSKGRIWASTYGGLVVLVGSKSRQYNIENGFPDNLIRFAFEDRNGAVWVGTKNAGLIVFDSLDEWEQITIDDGMSSNYVMSIEEDNQGRIIVGTISGLNILQNRTVLKSITAEDGLPSNFMFSTLAKSDRIWISSNDGLIAYSEDQIVKFNTSIGMPTNIIYDVLEDAAGNFWLPSENSILLIKREDIEAVLADPTQSIKVRQFDKSYGMKNSHCLGAVHSYRDSSGNLWVPTVGGIVKLNPNEVQSPNFNPKTILEDISADGKAIQVEEVVKIPAGTNRLLIDFTGISYRHTDLLEFRYRLRPFDQGWITATEDRNGLYTNLAPGLYAFEVQTGLDGTFETEITTQKILIEALWYQTGWARALMVLIAILLIALFYWIRTKSLTINNQRLEATVKERTSALEAQKLELKDAIEQLKNAQQQMVQSDKMASLGILSAGVAHEINNPLNFIQGGVEGLEQMLKHTSEIDPANYSELLRAIKEGISRASTIVSSLNEFSHSSDKKMEPCNLYHLIDNCLTMIRYRLKAGIEIKKELPEGVAMVMGNNGKLHQAILNILTNSMQAIEKKGEITIKARIEGGFIKLEFIDTGQGIKPENLKKITEPFFSTKDPGQGTGLGLSITYSIIREHGGTLTYESEWGKGTTASVVLRLQST